MRRQPEHTRGGTSGAGHARRLLSCALALALAAAFVPVVPATAAETSGSGQATEGGGASEAETGLAYADDEVVIVYEDEALALDDTLELDEDGELAADADELTLAGLGICGQTELDADDAERGSTVVATLDGTSSVEELVAELADDPAIASVQPNYLYELMETTTNDPYATSDSSSTTNQYYLYSSGFTQAWDDAKVEGSCTIAVVDTGCDLQHEDLVDTVNTELAYDATQQTLLSRARVSNNGDASGHGTMVCGIVAATANNGTGIAGASYNANVLPVRVFDDDETCTTSDIVAAYSYLDGLIDAGTLTDLRVINMSVGAYASDLDEGDDAMHDAIAAMLEEHDVLTVCAGGNGDSSGNALTEYCYPGDYDECMSVTSVDESGANSTWSDYNDAKDIAAYGEDILSTYAAGTSVSGGGRPNVPGGYTQTSSSYASADGTSFSSPQVAAAVALVWTANPDLSAEQVAYILQSTADEVTGNVHASSSCAGILDVSEAVSLAAAYDADGAIDISQATVTFPSSSYTYNGSARTPTPTVRLFSRALAKGTDYTVTYSNNLNAGTAHVTITGCGDYTGTVTATFAIAKRKITSATLSKASYVYKAGKKRTPGVTVKDSSGSKLARGTHYTVTYASGRKAIGRYKVTVKGTGNYTGTIVRYFKIRPGKASLKKSATKSTAAGKIAVRWRKKAGGVKYEIAYRKLGSSTWHYRRVSTSTRKKVLAGLASGAKYRVKVRAYKNASGTTLYGRWSSAKTVRVK